MQFRLLQGYAPDWSGDMQANEFTFSIEGKDADVLAKFKKAHARCLAGTAGDRFSYSFSPSSLGMAITVNCSCGQKLFLGDFMDHDARNIDLNNYGPLSKEDIANRMFEDDAYKILQMEDPRICVIGSAMKQSFHMIYFFAVGIASHSDPRIAKSILPSYSLDEHHHQTNNYTGTDEESIDLFYKYFKKKIREEIKKYDCRNERLIKKLEEK